MLWLGINGIEEKYVEDIKRYYSDDLLEPIKKKHIIKIGSSRFEGLLEHRDKLVMIDDEKFDRACNCDDHYNKWYKAGYEDAIKHMTKHLKELKKEKQNDGASKRD